MPDQYKNKNILITGGLGFIGSNLAIRLLEEGANLTLLDSMIEGYGGNLRNIEEIKEKVTINYSDMRDVFSLRYIVRDKDFIFNLAGQVSHIDSMTDPVSDLEINAKAQLTFLEACRQVNPQAKIIFASTRQFYGKPKYLPVDEKHPIEPPDVNGINKWAGEQYHLLYHKVYGLKSVALRLVNTYGPRQLIRHNRQGFIGWFIRKAVLGEKIQVYGTGNQLRDLIYVDDVVEALLLAGSNDETYGKIFNLGHDEKVSLFQLTSLLTEITGKGDVEIIPFPEERKKLDIGDFYGDYSEMRKVCGWKPSISLKEGLKRTVDYYTKYLEYYL
ncbi:MAG: NAD-dependent epimerase/dehydratase family protein [Nitrospiria bacterium]